MMRMTAAVLAWLVAIAPGFAQQADNEGWRALVRGDYAAAEQIWLPRAERGDVQAALGLGHLYSIRSEQDKAARWYERAAQAGDAVAQTLLATMYLHGRGVARDLVRAFAWYDNAASGGQVNAGKARDAVGLQMSPDQIEQAKALAAEFRADRAALADGG